MLEKLKIPKNSDVVHIADFQASVYFSGLAKTVMTILMLLKDYFPSNKLEMERALDMLT